MIKVSLKEAEGHLGELIEEAAAGQEVVITSAGGSAVRLMLVPQEEQEAQDSYSPPKAVGHALDRFIGTWSAEQEAEVLKAVEIFEQVDESFRQ
ncbi:MAG TPA: type II toxin-antitoxin system prevent-host-death family antitoxin [Thermoanaerobaculia bacterium]|nr:type II toxin-antitoxin system prevent-host-death family antitoxin [Thermoanaerobaculia bacterium]